MSGGPGNRPDSEAFPQPADQGVTRSQTLDSGIGSSQSNVEGQLAEQQDPLSHMSENDKWGLKGFSFLMNNFPDYASLVTGQDLSLLGFDLSSPE
jgi:CCR4-NOT transcription complex subunit 2